MGKPICVESRYHQALAHLIMTILRRPPSSPICNYCFIRQNPWYKAHKKKNNGAKLMITLLNE